MRQIASLLLLAILAVPMGAKWKTREKAFDPVSITDVRKAEGRYVGIDPDYVVNLRLDRWGTLTGTMTQFGVVFPLRGIQVSGAELYATVGGLPIHGTFVKRFSDKGYGLLVHDSDVKIDDVTISEIFCKKA